MGLCQDCNKKPATVIVLEQKTNRSFLICDDCISEDDILINQTINDIVRFESE